MIDTIELRAQTPDPRTFICNSRQIDGAWITPNVDVTSAYFLPFYFGVGDHRAILIDIPQHSLLGGGIHKIIRHNDRWLQCNCREIMLKHNDLLEIYSANHALQRKVYSLFPQTYPASNNTIRTMELINKVITEGMSHAEKECQKMYAGEVPFSDKLSKTSHCIKLWKLLI